MNFEQVFDAVFGDGVAASLVTGGASAIASSSSAAVVATDTKQEPGQQEQRGVKRGLPGTTTTTTTSSNSIWDIDSDDEDDHKRANKRANLQVETAPGFPAGYSLDEAFEEFQSHYASGFDLVNPPASYKPLPGWLESHLPGDVAQTRRSLNRMVHLLHQQREKAICDLDTVMQIFFFGHHNVTVDAKIRRDAPYVEHDIRPANWRWNNLCTTDSQSLVCKDCLTALQLQCDERYGSACPPVSVAPSAEFATRIPSIPRSFQGLNRSTQKYVHMEAARVAARNAHPQCLVHVLLFSRWWRTRPATFPEDGDELFVEMQSVLRIIIKRLYDIVFENSELFIRTVLCLAACFVGLSTNVCGTSLRQAIGQITFELQCAPTIAELLVHPWFNGSLGVRYGDVRNVFNFAVDACLMGYPCKTPYELDQEFMPWNPWHDDEIPDSVKTMLHVLAVLHAGRDRLAPMVRAKHPGLLTEETLWAMACMGVSMYSVDVMIDLGFIRCAEHTWQEPDSEEEDPGWNGNNLVEYSSSYVAPSNMSRGYDFLRKPPTHVQVWRRDGSIDQKVPVVREDGLRRHCRQRAPLVMIGTSERQTDFYYLYKLMMVEHQVSHVFVVDSFSVPTVYVAYTDTWHLQHALIPGGVHVECRFESMHNTDIDRRFAATLLRDNRVLTEREMCEFVDSIHAALARRRSGSSWFDTEDTNAHVLHDAVNRASPRFGRVNESHAVSSLLPATASLVYDRTRLFHPGDMPWPIPSNYAARLFALVPPCLEWLQSAPTSVRPIRDVTNLEGVLNELKQAMTEMEWKRVMLSPRVWALIDAMRSAFTSFPGRLEAAIRLLSPPVYEQMQRDPTYAAIVRESCTALVRTFGLGQCDRQHPDYVQTFDWAIRSIEFSCKWLRTFSVWRSHGVMLLKRVGFPHVPSKFLELCVLGLADSKATNTSVITSSTASTASSSSSSATATTQNDAASSSTTTEHDAASALSSSAITPPQVSAYDRALSAFRVRHRIEIRVIPKILEYL